MSGGTPTSRVNRRFAEKAAALAAEDALVWVHDYQLQLVPAMLRELRPDLRIGFFLHIPFPPSELFVQLPWRRQILEGLLGADLVGFQRPGGAQNFVRLVRQRVGHKTHRDLVYLPDGRTVQADAFPISIDFEGWRRWPGPRRCSSARRRSASSWATPGWCCSGVDRLDYTKGIYDRLRAYGELLADGELSVEDAVFVQVATPSRERVDEYRRLRDEIDRLVGRINGDYGRIGRPGDPLPAHLLAPRGDGRALPRRRHAGGHSPARRDEPGGQGVRRLPLPTTPARWCCRSSPARPTSCKQAFLVNPYDINGMKAAVLDASRARPADLTRRMKAMRKTVKEHDVATWAAEFLGRLGHVRPHHEKHTRDAEG